MLNSTRTKIYTLCFVLLLAGFIASLSLYSYINDTIELERDQILSSYYNSVHEGIDREIERNLNALFALRANFMAHDGWTYQEFQKYSSYYTNNIKSIQALEWVPAISFSQRDSFESEMRKSGFAEFQITTIRNDSTIRAEKREMYYPVTYIEPLKGNEKALGFDPGIINEPRQHSIEKAIKTKNVCASDLITIIQKTEPHKAILVFVPIFDTNNKVIGLVEGVYLMDQLISAALNDLEIPQELNLSLSKKGGSKEILFEYVNENKVQADKVKSGELIMADQTWELSLRQHGTVVASIIPPFAILIASLVFTLLIVKVVYDLLTDNRMALQKHVRSLEQKNNDLEQYAYVASHDLQEPLHSIQSLVNLIESEYHSKFDDIGRQYLRHTVEASKRMSSLITNLLHYSRIGQLETPEQVNCNDILNIVLKNFDKRIKETGAHIQVHNELPVLKGYPLAIEKLFQNLISNSIKFQSEGNQPRIEISCQKKGSKWEFCFNDNGIGFPQEYENQIFVIFKRLHNRSKFPGTGIGLANCKKIIEIHEGNIWVESKPGEGSTFYFTLNLM